MAALGPSLYIKGDPTTYSRADQARRRYSTSVTTPPALHRFLIFVLFSLIKNRMFHEISLSLLSLSFSKYGDVVLGEPNEKPKYSFFAWGSMMFTCGLAADILFYSFAEWVMYATNPHIEELGSVADRKSVV